MRRPTDTSDHLRALAAAANSTDDLAGSLDQLLVLAQRAVPTCIAVTLLLDSDSIPMSVTAINLTATRPLVRSSLAIRMPSRDTTTSVAPSPRLVLYATEPGVFELVARDLMALLDTHRQRAEVDAHLALPDADAQGQELGARLDDRRAVDLALGILLDRGLFALEGRAELDRLGLAHGTNHVEAARRIVSQAYNQPFSD